ncbi:aminoglycoside phosphotransferase family protein [Streptomyces sp. BI20]|uniref:aminoglycoside phosphotransferase family protein n=1 Tax=Streptomyces sp. BI20 TaxID=3403460 RepID=UPI003C7583E7
MEVPEGLRASQERAHGEVGREFLAGLPALADRFTDAWGLRRTGPVMHGMAALVLPVERADGTRAVLKLQLLDEESEGEPVALRAWDGRGAVRLLEHDEGTGTMLLERLDERRHLTELAGRDGDAAVRVIAELLARLTARPAPAGLRSLGDVAKEMLAQVPGALAGVADARARRVLRGCAAAVAEVADEPGDRLLHWDLHYENVLAAPPGARAEGRGEWLAIDPKPLAGDPGFELLPAIADRFDADVVPRWFDLMTGVLGLDRERARAWTLGRVLQNSLWELEDGEPLPAEQLVIAELLGGRALGAR